MDKYEVCTVDMVYTADRVVTVDAITIQTALPPLDYYDYWSTCGTNNIPLNVRQPRNSEHLLIKEFGIGGPKSMLSHNVFLLSFIKDHKKINPSI